VGRLDPIKDQITLLRAFNSLVKQSPRAGDGLRLVIVGGGDMQHELAQSVSDMRLNSLVTFAGASDDVASQLRTFDVFVLPSLNEGISNTILEAMATGLPVIATSVGGNPELVQQDVTGFLISAGDSEALARKLRYYLENPDVRREHGTAARNRVVNNFSMDSMVDHYVDLYDQAAEKRTAQQNNKG
jgi:glycosyltransferase involved in cell wall biosynthesis